MDRFEPTDLRQLFPLERAALLDLLRSLSPDEWQAPTVCPGWSVHQVVLHLLNGDLRFIADRRDGYQSPVGPRVEAPFGRAEVTNLVDTINNRWVAGAYFLSPRQLVDQLERSGIEYAQTLAGLDMNATGIPVDWIVSEPAPVWIDVAREFTERVIHQQQLRDATGRPLLTERSLIFPLFDTFLLALPGALRDIPAPVGSRATLTIRGPAGGTWTVYREASAWSVAGNSDAEPVATLTIDQDDAWRLFTRGRTPDVVRARAEWSGDPAAVEAMLRMVTVLA